MATDYHRGLHDTNRRRQFAYSDLDRSTARLARQDASRDYRAQRTPTRSRFVTPDIARQRDLQARPDNDRLLGEGQIAYFDRKHNEFQSRFSDPRSPATGSTVEGQPAYQDRMRERVDEASRARADADFERRFPSQSRGSGAASLSGVVGGDAAATSQPNAPATNTEAMRQDAGDGSGAANKIDSGPRQVDMSHLGGGRMEFDTPDGVTHRFGPRDVVYEGMFKTFPDDEVAGDPAGDEPHPDPAPIEERSPAGDGVEPTSGAPRDSGSGGMYPEPEGTRTEYTADRIRRAVGRGLRSGYEGVRDFLQGQNERLKRQSARQSERSRRMMDEMENARIGYREELDRIEAELSQLPDGEDNRRAFLSAEQKRIQRELDRRTPKRR